MGGKHWRSITNANRRKRKENKRKFLKHMMKHPDYYNESNPIPYRTFCMLVIFRLIWLRAMNEKVSNE